MISSKVWDQAGIELATPETAVRHSYVTDECLTADSETVGRHITDCATRPGIYMLKECLHILENLGDFLT